MHHAIPTTYNGVNFRSRLEAKYAAMFDQLGWNWEYEPVDMNGWIPDFIIRGVRPIYVEIKPIFEVAEAKLIGGDIVTALNLHHHPRVEALICGASLPQNSFDVPALGWLWDEWDHSWSPSHVFGLEGGGYDICSDSGSYAGRTTGTYDGGNHLHFGEADLVLMWRQAGNMVQWRRVAP